MHIQNYLSKQEQRLATELKALRGMAFDLTERKATRFFGRYDVRRQLEEIYQLPNRLPSYSEQEAVNQALALSLRSLKNLGINQSIPEFSDVIVANIGRGTSLAFTTANRLFISPELFDNEYAKEALAHEILRWGILGDKELVNLGAMLSVKPRMKGLKLLKEYELFDISTLPFFTSERDIIAEQAQKLKRTKRDLTVASGLGYLAWTNPVGAAMGGIFALPAYGTYRAVSVLVERQIRRTHESLKKNMKRSQLVADIILGSSPDLDYISFLENGSFPFDTMKGSPPRVRVDAVRHPEYQLANLDKGRI